MGMPFSRPLSLPSPRESDERSPQGSNLPGPKASVTLPPEILDKILEHICSDGRGSSTLISCALVATWCTGPCQRRLFSSVRISPDNCERWINGVVLSRSKAHLLGHVRSLNDGYGYRIQDLIQDTGEYLLGLHNLRSLTLHGIMVEHINERDFRTCFSAFRGTLTLLSLHNFATSFSAFVVMIDYFPNLTTLRLHPFVVGLNERSVPSLSRPLRGKLHLHHISDNCLEFFDRFAKLDPEYEELEIVSSSTLYTESRFVESALQISTSTVRFLRLIIKPERE